MTKEEYTEFLKLQEHYEWLHAAENRAKAKLKTFTTDDSEFDELVREAIKVYYETEIDKAWKKIEEFKTAHTFVADREDAVKYCSKKNEPEMVSIFTGRGYDVSRYFSRYFRFRPHNEGNYKEV